MKKIIFFAITILSMMLIGCSNDEKQIQKDIENQLAAIKTEEYDMSSFDILDRMKITDSKLNLNDIQNTDITSIFNNMEYSIMNIEVNKSTAIAEIELNVRDIDTILSKDNIVSDLILAYEDYVSLNPNDDRTNIDTQLINKIADIINKDNTYTKTTAIINVYYSSDDNKWNLSFDNNSINALLGDISLDYNIDFNDILEENKESVDINYDYDKILNLSNSNKTTRSSIKSPVSINEEAYFDNSDYFFEKERYELKIKLTDVLRGKEAYNAVINASANNKNISDNLEYILFKVNIKLVNNLTSEEQVSISSTDFSLLDSNGHYYNNCIIYGLDELQPLQEDEETEGYIGFIIDKNIEPYLLFKDYMDNTICFKY